MLGFSCDPDDEVVREICKTYYVRYTSAAGQDDDKPSSTLCANPSKHTSRRMGQPNSDLHHINAVQSQPWFGVGCSRCPEHLARDVPLFPRRKPPTMQKRRTMAKTPGLTSDTKQHYSPATDERSILLPVVRFVYPTFKSGFLWRLRAVAAGRARANLAGARIF